MDFNLSDYVKLTDENGNDVEESKTSWLEEKRLKEAVDSNKYLMARNKDIFAREEPKFSTCKMYKPCPICEKCLNKSSHLYIKCRNCKIPICTHTYHDRKFMIRRDNFKLTLNDSTKRKIFEGIESNGQI